jgi:hypothetical protein
MSGVLVTVRNIRRSARYGHAVEPSFMRTELADRAPHSQSPTRTHACRNEGLTPTHIYALDGMFTRHSGNAALFL